MMLLGSVENCPLLSDENKWGANEGVRKGSVVNFIALVPSCGDPGSCHHTNHGRACDGSYHTYHSGAPGSCYYTYHGGACGGSSMNASVLMTPDSTVSAIVVVA